MHICLGLSIAFLVFQAPAPPERRDFFDLYTNAVLVKMVDTDHVKELKQLTPDQLLEHDRVLPRIPAAFVVVKTNEGRYAKLIVQAARQRLREEGKFLSTVRLERYVTYKGGEEEAFQAAGQGVTLFPNFRFSLDLGQVVPEEIGGDLHFVADGDKIYLQPMGKARLFLVVKGVADLIPKKGPAKLIVGDRFEPGSFSGTYKLHDDGRRSGKLILKVEDDGSISGSYYSDKDGTKYEVRGRVGMPTHTVQFTIKFPRTEQIFQGFLFTGDGQVLTGSSRMNEREAGFYATRIEE